MPTFSTPQPITVHLELGGVGVIRLVASDRSDTAVEVRPTNPASKADVAAAEQTRVEYSDGQLTVKGPQGWRYYSGWGGARIDRVEIAMPAGSRLRGQGGNGHSALRGTVGRAPLQDGAGEIHADQTGSVTVRTGFGNVNIERAAGGRRSRRAPGGSRSAESMDRSRPEFQRRYLDRRCRGRAPGERRERQDRGRPVAVGGLRQNGERRHRARCGRVR